MSRREEGQAVIETILIGLLLLAPLIWTLTVLADLQRGALAATAAAREAGFEAARSMSWQDAARAVDQAVAQAFRDHGLDVSQAEVRWAAERGLPRGGVVEVRVSYPVSVARVPFLGRLRRPAVWVRASHTARSDRYRSRG